MILAILVGAVWGLLAGALSRPRWRVLPPDLRGKGGALRHAGAGALAGAFLLGVAFLAAAVASATGASDAAYHQAWMPASLVGGLALVLALAVRAHGDAPPARTLLPLLLAALVIVAAGAALLAGVSWLMADWSPAFY